MTYREFATPLTIGSFLLIAATGVLMFFHLDSGLNKLAHEWLGWIMLGAVALHSTMHFKSFQRHFTRPAALAVILLFVGLFAASFIAPSGQSNKSPPALAMQAVLNAPLDKVAALAGKDTASVLVQLDAAGLHATADQTLGAASGGTREKQMQALKIVFAAP
jgi:hypothetical protein